MACLKIKDLLLRAYIGFNPHEIGKRQDLLINITIDYDSSKEELSDQPIDALDYKTITKEIIGRVEGSRFNLLESLTRMILNSIMEHDRVRKAIIEVDKLHALRFSKSVSIILAEERK
ncbi:FolB domain-containing protein [Marinilabiliaceae bacterium JC017]|nr:FolB domain-containing protein [Marinilabiliaceae bacterium JC017]